MQTQRKSLSAPIIVSVVLLMIVVFGAIGWRVSSHMGPQFSSEGNEIGGTFRLMDLGGEGVVTEGDFHGQWVLMWFADASCPEAQCAPVYRAMSKAASGLEHRLRVAPLVVTLDPMEDDGNARRDAILKHGPNLVVLTGSPDTVYAVAEEYHAGVHKIAIPGSSYRMGPIPGRIVVMNPQGRYAGTIDTTATAEQIEARLEALAHGS